MRPHTTTPRPPAPNYAAVKRQRKGPAPLGDVTNLLLLPETPTPIKPGRPRLRTPSHSSSTCSSTAPITPAPKPPSSAAGDETPTLPEDFVKRRRAYFAEVDAFELPVEEVSDYEVE